MEKKVVLTPYQTKVLEHFRTCGASGATDEELRASIGNGAPNQRASLLAKGLLCASDSQRPNLSGRHANVWIASEFAGMSEIDELLDTAILKPIPVKKKPAVVAPTVSSVQAALKELKQPVSKPVSETPPFLFGEESNSFRHFSARDAYNEEWSRIAYRKLPRVLVSVVKDRTGAYKGASYIAPDVPKDVIRQLLKSIEDELLASP